jgi:CO/xanthine dehydrogenase Mo-binding subunit
LNRDADIFRAYTIILRSPEISADEPRADRGSSVHGDTGHEPRLEELPVLRFADHPNVTPIVVQRLNDRSTGAGEEVMGAAVGAAKAFFDATGARMREYPMTPDRVRATLKA